jgi:hypothetical protein
MCLGLFYKIDDIPECALDPTTEELQKESFFTHVRDAYGDYNGAKE